MAKAIKCYAGGVQYRIQAAVRGDGAIFMRCQDKGPYGYRWSAWQRRGSCDPANPPASIEAGFSELFPAGPYECMDKVRLPN